MCFGLDQTVSLLLSITVCAFASLFPIESVCDVPTEVKGMSYETCVLEQVIESVRTQRKQSAIGRKKENENERKNKKNHSSFILSMMWTKCYRVLIGCLVAAWWFRNCGLCSLFSPSLSFSHNTIISHSISSINSLFCYTHDFRTTKNRNERKILMKIAD